MIVAMPRDDAIIFSDLIGKHDLIRVACDKCGRDGCYGLSRLIEGRGRNAKLIDWLDEITADCAKKRAGNMNDPCGAKSRNCLRCFKNVRVRSDGVGDQTFARQPGFWGNLFLN
jgi:hypothetical protein